MRISTASTPARALLIGVLSAALAISAVPFGSALVATADEGDIGAISGTVYVTPDSPIAQVRPATAGEVSVEIWAVEDGAPYSLGEVLTDSSGAWTSADLDVTAAVGHYTARFDYIGTSQLNVLDTWYGGYHSVNEVLADYAYLDVDESGYAGADQTLEQAAKISGTVRNAASAVLAGQPVTAWRQTYDEFSSETWESVATATTATNGSYSLAGLPSGQYTLAFGGGSKGYVEQWWDESEATSAEDANSFWVYTDEGNTYSGYNATLQRASSISGVVKNTAKAAIPGILVTAYVETWDDTVVAATAVTNAAGAYTLPNLGPNDYTLGFESAPNAAIKYVAEYYDNQYSLWDADPIEVQPGVILAGKNVELVRASSISGVISAWDAQSVQGDFEVTACVLEQYDYVDCWSGFGETSYGANGSFTVGQLPPGSYSLAVVYNGPENYQDEYFSNARTSRTTTTFVVPAGSTITGKNITLDKGATFTGTTTFRGSPAVGVSVDVDNDSDLIGRRSTTTDSEGDYTLTGLIPGRHLINADPSYSDNAEDAIGQFYGGFSSQEGVRVLAAPPATVTGLDIDLVEGGTVTGMVTGLGGGPIAANVTLEDEYSPTANAGYEENDGSDESGQYTIHNVRPGTYRLSFSADDGTTRYLTQWYGGAPAGDERLAGTITVTSAGTTTANIQLTPGGSITGVIIGSEDEPIEGANVSVAPRGKDFEDDWVANAESDDTGAFIVPGLASGVYDVRIDRGWSDTSFAKKVVSTVTVTAGAAPTSLGTIATASGSTISGRLLSSTGVPLKDASVSAFVIDDTGRQLLVGESDYSDSSGRFTVQSLPAGTIYLRSDYIWQSESVRYPEQFIGGSSDIHLATPIVVTEGSFTYRDFRLTLTGSVTGVVTSTVTKKVIPNVPVTARLIDPETGEADVYYSAAGVTTAKGAYVLPGLAPGAYEVSYNRSSSGGSLLPVSTSTTQIYVPENKATVKSVALGATTRISGVVKDATGAALDEVSVQAYRWNGSTATPLAADWERDVTVTSGTGAYALYLTPGTYVIQFVDPQHRGTAAFLGGGASAASPQTTKLVVGAKAIVGNVVLASGDGTVNGVVRDSTGARIVGTVTQETLVDGVAVASEQFNPYDFPLRNLRDGDYRLRIEAYSFDQEFTTPTKVVTFTLSGGILTTVNGAAATSPNSLGVITLAPPVMKPVPTLVTSAALPAISGTPAVGSVLTASTGTWSTLPETYGYQWLRDGRLIRAATNASYTVTPGDAGHRISFSMTVNSADRWYPATDFHSAETAIVAAGAAPVTSVSPTIVGVPRVGTALTATTGTWTTPGLSYRYEWVRTSTNTVVSTLAGYKPVAADVSSTLELRVYASRTGYAEGLSSVTSAAVAYGLAPKATKLPRFVAGTVNYTAVAGTFTPTGVAQSFEWQFSSRDSNTVDAARTIVGATASREAINADALRVELVVTATRAGYAPTVLRLPVRSGAAIDLVADPIIVGTPQLGLPLTATIPAASTTPSSTAFGYQWYRGTVKIVGATKAQYVPVALDVNKQLKVTVQAVQAGYTASVVRSSEVVTVAPATPFAVGTPTVVGAAAVGRVVTANVGTWTPAPTAYAYQWYRVNTTTSVATPIAKAIKAAYAVTAADRGSVLRVRVTASRLGYVAAAATADSAAIVDKAVTSTTLPTLPITARVGTPLLATAGGWDLAPTAYAYQWFSNDQRIIGATSSSYTPIVSDLGEDLRVEVTAAKTGYPTSAAVSSLRVTVTEGVAVKATALPVLTVAGKAVKQLKNGQVLVASSGTWPVTPLSLGYQWQVKTPTGVWEDLQGETSRELYIESSIGNSFRMKVVAEKAGYASSLPIYSAILVLKP